MKKIHTTWACLLFSFCGNFSPLHSIYKKPVKKAEKKEEKVIENNNLCIPPDENAKKLVNDLIDPLVILTFYDFCQKSISLFYRGEAMITPEQVTEEFFEDYSQFFYNDTNFAPEFICTLQEITPEQFTIACHAALAAEYLYGIIKGFETTTRHVFYKKKIRLEEMLRHIDRYAEEFASLIIKKIGDKNYTEIRAFIKKYCTIGQAKMSAIEYAKFLNAINDMKGGIEKYCFSGEQKRTDSGPGIFGAAIMVRNLMKFFPPQ